MKNYLSQFFPIFHWLPNYNFKRHLKNDLIAGLTVGMMIIPQEISFSSIMGVPPIYGLYTASIVPMIYPIFGSSPVLSIANSATLSLIIQDILESYEPVERRIAIGVFLTFYCGIIMICMGILRLGIFVDFISRPVMNGYITGVSILIVVSQLPPCLGIQIRKSISSWINIYRIAEKITQINVLSTLISFLSIGFMVIIKYTKKKILSNQIKRKNSMDSQAVSYESSNVNESFSIPSDCESDEIKYDIVKTPKRIPDSSSFNEMDITESNLTPRSIPTPQNSSDNNKFHSFICTLGDLNAMIVSVFGMCCGYLIGHKSSYSFPLAGYIPSGLPRTVLPWDILDQTMSISDFGNFGFDALIVTIVAYMTSISIGKKLAIRDGYKIRPNQELFAIGIANVIGSTFQSLPSTAALARTILNADVAHTQLASIFTSCLVMLFLLVATEPLQYLPLATLSSIIIGSVVFIIDFKEGKWLYHIKPEEFWVWFLSLTTTISIGSVYGLVFSMLYSIVAIMWKTKAPKVLRVTREDLSSLINIHAYDRILNHIIILRLYGSMYFGNSECIVNDISENLISSSHQYQGILVELSRCNDVDITSIYRLLDLIQKLHQKNIQLKFCCGTKQIDQLFQDSNILEKCYQHSVCISIEEGLRLYDNGTQH